MIYRFGDGVLDSQRRELTVDGAPVHLERQVFDVLRFLLENRDRVVSRDELIEAVWQGRIVSEATISARIFAARRAVGDTGKAQKVIRTLPRSGFRFVAPVCADASSPTETASPSQRDQVPMEGWPHGKPRFLKLLMPGNRWGWSMLSLAAATLSAIIGSWWLASNQAALDRGEPNPIGVRTVAVLPFDTGGWSTPVDGRGEAADRRGDPGARVVGVGGGQAARHQRQPSVQVEAPGGSGRA